MVRIVVLDGATLNPGDNSWDDLGGLGPLTVYDRSAPSEILDRAKSAEILIVNKVSLTGDTLRQLPVLRYIAVTATGHDCVDSAAARQLGISVSNVPVYGTQSVAQHVFALLLHLLHRIDLHDATVRAGEWQRRGDFSFWMSPLVELSGLNLGIVGLGRIGRAVARIGQAMGMNIAYCSRSAKDDVESSSWQSRTLESLLRCSDVVSLHCPLSDQTRGLINAERLAWMKPTAYLINASRGALIEEADLAAALNTGRLAGAGVDVVSVEPIRPDNPLLAAQRCVISPHLAWATLAARRRLMQITVANVAAYLQGTPQNVVNR